MNHNSIVYFLIREKCIIHNYITAVYYKLLYFVEHNHNKIMVRFYRTKNKRGPRRHFLKIVGR